MIPTLVPALAQHGRLQVSEGEQAQLLTVSAATIDRMLGDVNGAAAGDRRRRAGFCSAIRREVPMRMFDPHTRQGSLAKWNSLPCPAHQLGSFS
jgi:hypothetical protein